MTGRTRLEPLLPFKRENNAIEKCQFFWENIPRIQLETNADWWGNSVSDTQMGGDYYKFSDEPILADGQFLARKAALALKDCNYLLKSGIADNMTAESRNPYGDRIDTDIRVTEKIIGRVDIIEAGNYSEAELPPVAEFNIIQDVILGGPEDTITDMITGTTPDNINDQVIPE